MRLLALCGLGVAVAAGLGGCNGSQPHGTAPAVDMETERALRAAAAYADSLIALASRDRSVGLSDEAVVAVGYLERLRLGLGSPFRLIEHALRDTRLSDTMRVRVARALLVRAASGDSYSVDPAAVEAALAAGIPDTSLERLAAAHKALIERAVSSAREPRAGELAVRLAYTLAAAGGHVGTAMPQIAAQLAALRRDRIIAMADARRLWSAANAQAVDPSALVGRWRAEQRFMVERPPLADASEEFEPEAVALADTLLERLKAMRAPAQPDRVAIGGLPLMSRTTAARWAELARTWSAPPEAAVVVPVRTLRLPVLGSRRGGGRAVRARFLDRARDDETLAAEHAVVVRSGATNPGISLALLRAAVALRAYAQEAVLAPGASRTTASTLVRRYRLRAVDFDRGVPTSWRRYYLDVVDGALRDAQRVVPALAFGGLRVRIGRTPLGDVALALHDPRTRTLYLPPGTGSGVIAHELAHDLDWTAIEWGDYTTDQSVRRGQEELAAALGRLTPDPLIPPTPENQYRVEHARRPAEVFAREFDWFLAASLAFMGRRNGHLSAAQDEVLTGYAGVTPPDVTGRAADAMVELLERMTRVPVAVRAAFLERYGPVRALTAYDRVRNLLQVPAPEPEEVTLDPRRFAPSGIGASPALATEVDECRESEIDDARALATARARAEALAAELRAEALVRRWSRERSDDEKADLHVRALAGPPWDPRIRERAANAVRDSLLARAARADPRRLFLRHLRVRPTCGDA